MDLPAPDYRLLPVLDSAEVWVALDSASAAPKGALDLLDTSEVTAPILAGLPTPLGGWQDEAVWLYDEFGKVCQGTLDRGAIAVSVRFAQGRAPWLTKCSGFDQCPELAAQSAWDAASQPLVVAHVRLQGSCENPLWAQRRDGSIVPSPPIFADPIADEHLVNLAVARFRSLAGWRAVQDRWMSVVVPLDATEWDTTGGSSPEVSRFVTSDGRTLITVSAAVGELCGSLFTAAFSATFMQGADRTLAPFQPSGLPPDSPFPGFAPLVLNRLAPGSFAARGMRGSSTGTSLDVRPEPIGACTPTPGD